MKKKRIPSTKCCKTFTREFVVLNDRELDELLAQFERAQNITVNVTDEVFVSVFLQVGDMESSTSEHILLRRTLERIWRKKQIRLT